jgi:hypothetical protein
MTLDDYKAAARTVLRRAMAAALAPNASPKFTDDDVAYVTRGLEPHLDAFGLVLDAIIDQAAADAMGDIVSRIRVAEGIDTVAVDATLAGIEPEPGDWSDDTPTDDAGIEQ